MPAVAQRQLKFICGSGHLARATYAMITTEYSDDRAGPAATGMMTLPRFPSGSRQQTHHRVEWIRLVDNALAAKGLLATAKTGTVPTKAETLINIDMDEIPELAVRGLTRIWCEDATEIYTMLYQSVEDANKTLAAELRRHCDMATQSTCTALAGHCWEGYWDGHKAYRLLSRHLFNCERTEADKVNAGGEAMDCDDDGRDWVGDTGTHRGGKRGRGGGDGARGRGQKERPRDALRWAIWHCEAHAGGRRPHVTRNVVAVYQSPLLVLLQLQVS